MLPSARRLVALTLSAWLAFGPALDAFAQVQGVARASSYSRPAGPFLPVSPRWAQAFFGLKSEGISLDQGSVLSRVLSDIERPEGRRRLEPLVQALEARGLKPEDLLDRGKLVEVEASAKEAAVSLHSSAH